MKPNVLVVDASMNVRVDLRVALTAAGFSVFVADSWATAQKLLQGVHFSLVIADPLIPGAEGVDIVREIRCIAGHDALPVMLLVGDAEAVPRFWGVRSVPEASMAKPCDPAALTQRAWEVITRAEGSGHVAVPASCRKILAVDDSATYLEALTLALSSDGFDIICAHSVQEALERLSREAVHCVIMDLVMPGLDGLEGARRIRANPAWSHIPVLILTGIEDDAARREGAAIGVDGFVLKSPEMSLIRVHLRRALSRGRGDPARRGSGGSGRGLRLPQAIALFERIAAATGLSPLVGSVTIRHACERAGVDPQNMTVQDLERVLPAIQQSIGVFLPKPEHEYRAAALAAMVHGLLEHQPAVQAVAIGR